MYYTGIGKSKLLTYSGSHTHDEWEIVLNLEGEGVTTVGEVTLPIAAGTVVCIPPRVPHTKTVAGGFRDIFIHYPTLRLPAGGACFADEDGRVEQLMSMIHAIYHKGQGNYREITEHLAQALSQIIVEKVGATPTDPRVSHMADLAVENFNDPDFSMTKKMEESGYCTDHFRRLFRRAYGESPLEYLTSLRVNFAKRLLRENDCLHYTVAQIATMSGFSDISYFSRVFKKCTGVSPRAYMQGTREKE